MGCTQSKATIPANVESIPSLKGFQGEIFHRDDKSDSQYALHRYQYAFTSYKDGSINPAIIFYAKDEEDIKMVIRYAREKNIAIALRTGGHQYCGASSTSGPNIQLDLSRAFCSEEDFQYDESTNRLRVGISFPLRVFNETLAKKGLFIPHGECENVHIGGHVQSGGYGQLYRAFGLFADHVKVIEIITADAEKKLVTRESNSDLFFAILGGSPGSFGVITHVVIEPHRDADHPNSRGLFAIYLYDAERLRRLLKLATEFGNDDSLPIDYDYTVTMLTFSQDFISLYPNMDNHMRERHPDLYGGLGKEASSANPSGIVVFAQWSNTQGKDQPYDDAVAQWFKRIKEAAHGLDVSGMFGNYLENEHHVPMSKLTHYWIFLKVREFELPYIKRGYFTGEKVGDDWVDSFVQYVIEVQSNLSGTDCKISAQIQSLGKASKVFLNKDNGTSYNWRDSVLSATCDIFYGPRGEAFAKNWQDRNDKNFVGKKGTFSRQDRRVFWASYGNRNLSEVFNFFLVLSFTNENVANTVGLGVLL